MVERDLLHAEAFAFPLTLLLLLFVFGSLVAAAMPLTIGAVAVVGTLLVLRILNSITPVSIYAVNLATVLGLGLAIDYSLFIVSRFREELWPGTKPEPRSKRRWRTPGGPWPGAPSPWLRPPAPSRLPPRLPPVLRILGHCGGPPRRRGSLGRAPRGARPPGPADQRPTVWRRSVRPPADGFWSRRRARIMRRPVPVIIAVAVVLAHHGRAVRASPLGYLDDRVLAPTDHVRQVDDTLRAEFGQGQTDALQVVVPTSAAPRRPSRRRTPPSSRSFRRGERRLPPVASTSTATRCAAPAGYMAQFSRATGSGIRSSPRVTACLPREKRSSTPFGTARLLSPMLVGGYPASLVDSTAVINHYLPLAVLIVVAATFLILLFLFRSSSFR